MSDPTIENPHARSSDEVVSKMEVDSAIGLTSEEADARLEECGRNELKEEKPVPVWRLILAQFETVVVYILAAAMVLAFATGRIPEGWALFAVVLINAAVGFISEWRARESMAALKAMGKPNASVLRDGEVREIAIESVVPGDILAIHPEDVIPADARLLEADGLRISEAALTGESVPVDKETSPQDENAPLAERFCMVFKGTTVTEGTGRAVVTATGSGTELGHISQLASGESSGEAPLQKRLDQLGARLAYLSLGLAVVIGGIGLIAGRDLVAMVETALALGVAMVPEGLPIVATIALARGMWLLARRNAIINRLTAVQTLGATQVICTDKTGTLTHNRMVMRRVITPTATAELTEKNDGETYFEPSEDGAIDLPAHAIRLGVLCNNAVLAENAEEDSSRGDPTEIALLQAGYHLGSLRSKLLQEFPETREVDFDPEVMMMATFHRQPESEGLLVAVKGAPDRVLEACSRVADGRTESAELDRRTRDDWKKRGEELAADGFRVLAVADKVVSEQGAPPYQELRLVGFLALDDPPREDVRDAIEACHRAGIEVVMVTGDQSATARAVGQETAIVNDDNVDAHEGRELDQVDARAARDLKQARLFARVSPEQKLHLVKLLQEDGKVVAMTGDGVNDTPALKRADIGIAMGERGTDAAKQASDMVLKDDNFSTILEAIELGRIIFGNIRKSVIFMLCTNLAEIIAVGVAAAVNSPLPLLPLQILYLNILTDVFPALALGVGRGHRGVLDDPPRPSDEGILTKREWTTIGTWGGLLAFVVLGALYLALQWAGLEENAAITVSFLTLGFSKMLFVFNLREPRSGLIRNDIVGNRWIWGALVLCGALLLAAVHVPILQEILKTQSPGATGWMLVGILSTIPVFIGQTWLAFQARKA